MSATTAAWLVLAMPLAGMLLIALLFKWMPAKLAGWVGTGRDRRLVRLRPARAHGPAGPTRPRSAT